MEAWKRGSLTLASIRRLALLLAPLTLVACGPGFRTAPGNGAVRSDEGPVRLNVTNYSGGPVEVYALGAGTSYRLGTVLPGLAGHFSVHPALTIGGPVEFVVDAGRGQALSRSGRMLLMNGDVVDFDITTHPETSIARVRPW